MRDFGTFSNTILVGNFGNGRVAAFKGFTHKFEGFVKNPDDSLLFMRLMLWPSSEKQGRRRSGLFGTLTPVPAEQDGSVE